MDDPDGSDREPDRIPSDSLSAEDREALLPDPIVDGGTPRSDKRWRIAILVAALASLLTLAGTAFLSVGRVADQATKKDSLTSQARADCARRIGNEQAEVRDERDNLVALFVLERARGLDAGETSVADELRDAIAAVNDLPPSQVVVNRECPEL